jgi:hypothetical protein
MERLNQNSVVNRCLERYVPQDHTSGVEHAYRFHTDRAADRLFFDLKEYLASSPEEGTQPAG